MKDLDLALLVVLFFGLGFAFGYGLNTASCPVDAINQQGPQ